MTSHRPLGRHQLELFQALPGDLAPRDAQDLMAYPFFSLAKTLRTTPIDFRAGDIAIRVEAVPEHGMATIWDADILIWAASQIVEARDHGIRSSRLMAATPYEILTFTGRGTSIRDYHRLKAALDRLQSTTIATSIRQPSDRRMHRFSWVNEWKERIFRPEIVARFVLNRCAARTVIARETAEALADHDPPVLASRVGQRIAFADAARTGRLVCELDKAGSSAREIVALATEIAGLLP